LAHRRKLQILNSTQPNPNPKPILPDGTKMRLSAWVKEGKSGKRFLSGKVEPFQQQTSGGNFAPQDGDMPF
jgi:hypothetical protein